MFKQTTQGAINIVSGDDVLNEETVESAASVTRDCIHNGQPRLVFNLENVPLIDSDGLAFLLDTRDECAGRGGTLKLAAPNALCTDILKVTGIDSQLEIFDDVVKAAGSFVQ